MRFESIVAHAFGPLVDETLELAPGMNVVYGPNEAGKSTWHAALYAGLCGMRRGAGQTNADRVFMHRHKPWNGTDAWEVGAVIARDEGVRVELRHDLANRTGTAHDADTGRDVASQIIHQGAPDGAAWLGLDRRSFLGTACVRQADTVRVLQAAEGLQEVLQRAADTAGTDATAARANELLQKWHAGHVGSARAFTRPLAVARKEADEARERLANARRAHEEYLGRRADVERLHAAADQAARDLAGAEGGISPRNPAEHADLAAQVQTAMRAWSSRPRITEPTGPTLEELAGELQETEQQLGSPSTAWSLTRWFLFILGCIIVASLSFRYGGPEHTALVVFAFAAGGIAWRQRRSRQDALLWERRTRIDSEVARRREDDRRYDDDVARCNEAEDALHRAADHAGIVPGETQDRAMALEGWLQQWRQELRQWEQRERQLQSLRQRTTEARSAEHRARGVLDQFCRKHAGRVRGRRVRAGRPGCAPQVGTAR